jgi:hypothetical protein
VAGRGFAFFVFEKSTIESFTCNETEKESSWQLSYLENEEHSLTSKNNPNVSFRAFTNVSNVIR